MTDRVVDRKVTEVSSRPTPGASAAALRGEVLSRASPGASAAAIASETVATPWPSSLVDNLLAESLAYPQPPIDAPAFLVEVLRRDTASSAIVATGMDAFGDQPWPDAQRGVFALRHDWAAPLVERLEWQTSVTRLASGNESRQARRRVPRRWLTYRVGNARQTDALVADWLADHLGQAALWPMPQYAVHMSSAAARGALALNVTNADWQHFGPLSANLRLTPGGVQGWQEGLGNGRWVLIIAADGWQVAQLSDVQSNRLWLTEPLARAAATGSTVMPLVWGSATDPAGFTQWVPGMVGGNVPAQIQPAPLPNPGVLSDPWLDEIPVWPDGNWRDDPTTGAQATITRQDFSPADPWVRRDDPWSTATFQRRYLAGSANAIEIWRARLWRTQGRLQAFWLPDGLAPVLRVTSEASPDDGYLRVSGEDVSAFWHRPAACVIAHPDGSRQHALTSICHFDQGGVLVLRSGIDQWVPVGSRVIRLVRCRLDHDAVDLHWHSAALVEITLTARQVPEPRGNDRETYGEYAV
ncbi:hypothetical protein SMCB_0681 [Serpentinimonas maccroryi]|uniref:Uncharacterized protein n=1 Tax=Serpentinimonas maccroryi TaxID=1458426 RepID=A0A060NVJ6_9BURK|nr:hypothetical protein [Serpentinimonas maccroryi]BAO82909.1 hypothetical protein SMCB_0681 [Serpentinimonas maccroryi]